MEKKVNELVNRIMNLNKLDIRDLNEIITIHNYIYKTKHEYEINQKKIKGETEATIEMLSHQMKRIEMLLKDKLKQISIYLSDDYLDNVINMIFYKASEEDIKDLRLINKHEIAVIRENSIDLSDLSHNADSLSPGSGLYEEAYLRECNKGSGEPEIYDPEKTFSHFFEEMDEKINNLKETLNISENISDKNVNLYFDRNLDSFFFDRLESFTAITTELPNVINVYEITIKDGKWIPKKISGDTVRDFMDRLNFTLLEEDFLTTDLKERYNGKCMLRRLNEFDIEMILEKFKTASFSLEVLVETYSSLFEENNCMYEEKENVIERLKYITAEKLVQNGFEYEKAIRYAKTIFDTIKEYKKQIIGAINGNDNFPNDSLVGVVKKLNYPKK